MTNIQNSYFYNFNNNIYGNKPVRRTQETQDVFQCNKNYMTSPTVSGDCFISTTAPYTKTGVEKLSNGQEIHCYKLANGQTVYIAPKESATTVLNTYVNTGAMNEKDDERGISHFCEHMAFNGTDGTCGYYKLGKGDVFGKIDDIGGYTNACTNYAETNYTISIPQFNKDDFETIVKMQSSMMNNLSMTKDMVEKEHGPVISEINMYSDMMDNIAKNIAITNLYNINTTSPDLVAGTVENISNIDSKKVMDYYKNNYYPANMTTVVTGDVNPDEAIQIIARNFKGTNPQNPDQRNEKLTPITQAVRKDIISPKATATEGVICFNGPDNNNVRDNITLEAVNMLLFDKNNSTLKKQLEKENLSASRNVEKFSSLPNQGKLLTISYNATEQNSENALQIIFNNLANFKMPTYEETENIKTAMKMKYENSFDDMEDLNNLIGQYSFIGNIDTCTQAINIINSLTPQDIYNVVHKYYDVNKASIAVVHPQSATADSINKGYDYAKNISFTGTKSIKNFVGDKKQAMKTDDIVNYKLNNNCNLAILETNNNIVNYAMQIKAEAPANTKPGVREILSIMLEQEEDYQKEFGDKNNIFVNHQADNKTISISAELPAENLAAGLNLGKDMLFNPNLSEDKFQKAKQKVKDELSKAKPNAYDNIKKVLYPNTPDGYTNEDILNNLDNIKLEDIRGLYQYFMENSEFKASVCVAKDKYPNASNIIIDELSKVKQFKNIQPKVFNDYTPVAETQVVTKVASTAQAEVLEDFKFNCDNTPKQIATIDIMNTILSNGKETGLFNNLREKEKLAYMVYSSVDMNSNSSTGVLECRILTTTDTDKEKSYDNVQKSITGFNNQINLMKSGSFTDSELENAKLNLKKNILQGFEKNSARTLAILNRTNSVNGQNEINQIYDAIDSITRDDITNMAQTIFSNKPVYSIVASEDTLKNNKEFLSQLK